VRDLALGQRKAHLDGFARPGAGGWAAPRVIRHFSPGVLALRARRSMTLADARGPQSTSSRGELVRKSALSVRAGQGLFPDKKILSESPPHPEG